MEILLRRRLQWDIEVAVVREDGGLGVTPYACDPDFDTVPLEGPAHVVWSSPLAVAGPLPEGVVEVRAARDGVWSTIDVAGGAWLACAVAEPADDPLDALLYVRADGTTDPIPRPPEHEPPPEPELTDAGRGYAAALAAAIADDVAADPPAGPLRRAVIRWFWEGDPQYLTIHVLGDDDAQPASEDAWYPLEWENADRELARTDRVMARPEVVQAAEALTATFPRDGEGDVHSEAHVPAVLETVRLLPEALRARGIELAERFAASAAHFEGWGALDALDAIAPPTLVAALRAHGELPEQ